MEQSGLLFTEFLTLAMFSLVKTWRGRVCFMSVTASTLKDFNPTAYCVSRRDSSVLFDMEVFAELALCPHDRLGSL